MKIVQSKLILIAALTVVTSAVCGGGESQNALSSPPEEQRTALVLAGARLDQARKVASPDERVALQDGVLEFSEYERIVLDTINCLEEHGLTVVNFSGSSIGTYGARYDLNQVASGYRVTSRGRIIYEAMGSTTYDESASMAAAACKANSALVESLWAEHTAPDDREQQLIRDFVGTCARERGFDAPEHPSIRDIQRLAFPPDGTPESDQRFPRWIEDCDASASASLGLD